MNFEKIRVEVQTLSDFKGDLPAYATIGSSGMDVRAQLPHALTVEPGSRVLIPTALKLAIPSGYEIQVRPRSGWAIREGLTVVNSPGTIDSDYRGELKIGLINLGEKSIVINDQDRIAQLVLCPVMQIVWQLSPDLSITERDAGGFGSTGRV